MSKAVLISIKPEWCEKIANGNKTIDLRKTRPKVETPFKCYIYCTKDKHGWFDFLKKERLDGKVIGEFMCDEDGIVNFWYPYGYNKRDCSAILRAFACLSANEIWEYGKGKTLYGWHISNLKIYDEPRELSEFGLKRPPQSWCYVEET